MSGARVVVTGGCGFIGSHLVDVLASRGDEVVVLDGAPPRQACPGARYVTADIRDAAQVAEVIGPGVDAVYHLAAVVGVDQYLARTLDVIDVNVTGTRNVLAAAARAGARVLVTSTSEVFGKHPAVPWREDGDRLLGPTTADRWAYSSSKALAEHLTFAFRRRHELDAVIVRYFNVYGPGQRPAYVISRSVHRVLNGRAPVIYDNGQQTRCFTYVADAVAGTVAAMGCAAADGEVINIGSNQETTVASAIALVSRLASGAPGAAERLAAAVDTAAAAGPAYQDLARRIPDTSKAKALLGWECQVTLEAGLAMTIAWARANAWWLALPDSGLS